MGKFVILSVNDGMWSKWGAQYVAKARLLREQRLVVDKIDAVNGRKAILDAIAACGAGGTLIMNTGHGALPSGAQPGEGMFQLMPSGAAAGNPGSMDICGRNAPSTAFVGVFYDEPKQKPNVSDIDFDTGKSPPPARLLRWQVYLEIGAAIKAQGLERVILISCDIGAVTQMMNKVAADWGTKIQAYKVELKAEVEPGKGANGPVLVHSINQSYVPGSTDLESWKTEIPTADMAVFSPPPAAANAPSQARSNVKTSDRQSAATRSFIRG